jgi:hypothetical protein
MRRRVATIGAEGLFGITAFRGGATSTKYIAVAAGPNFAISQA